MRVETGQPYVVAVVASRTPFLADETASDDAVRERRLVLRGRAMKLRDAWDGAGAGIDRHSMDAGHTAEDAANGKRLRDVDASIEPYAFDVAFRKSLWNRGTCALYQLQMKETNR